MTQLISKFRVSVVHKNSQNPSDPKKPTLESGFVVRIHCVRVQKADSYKKVCGYKNIRILADWALVWTEKCIEMLHCQTKRISVDGA